VILENFWIRSDRYLDSGELHQFASKTHLSVSKMLLIVVLSLLFHFFVAVLIVGGLISILTFLY